MQLYSRAASSCSYRVRIGLNLKQLQYELIPLTAVDQGKDPFRSLNPQRLVPLLVHKGHGIGQSLAILEYLEEVSGSSGAALLPKDPSGRARVRAISQYIVSEIQPLQNTRLDAYLHQLGVDDMQWKIHWIQQGFPRVEEMLSSEDTGEYCHGDAPTMVDCCLIPQVWNAVHRYGIHMPDYPIINGIYERCMRQSAFVDAMPEKQIDYAPPKG